MTLTIGNPVIEPYAFNLKNKFERFRRSSAVALAVPPVVAVAGLPDHGAARTPSGGE